MHITGPKTHEQHRTCVAGQRCVVKQIEGTYLSGDRLHSIRGVRIAQDGGLFYDAKSAAAPGLSIGSGTEHNAPSQLKHC